MLLAANALPAINRDAAKESDNFAFINFAFFLRGQSYKHSFANRLQKQMAEPPDKDALPLSYFQPAGKEVFYLFFHSLLIAIRACAFHHIVDVMERKALWNVHHRHTLVLKAIRFLALFAIEMHMLVGVMRTAAT